uniref:Choline kinase alpha n=1 Tax=Talaromyces marneffei PM1 TaxID=1077442 RepID=A0A093VRL3_TALMA
MATDADIEASVFSQLASTKYACSSLTRLNGGTANFVYRGVLSNPESIGTTEQEKANVIIKHTKDFVALNREFKLDGERCVFEALVLKGLNDFSSAREPLVPPITVKTPRLYDFDPETHTQIMEDLPESSDLKTFLLSPPGMHIDKPAARAIGHALGSWLGSFHAWISHNEQIDLRQKLGENKSMQQLKYVVNYDQLVNMIDKYPQILEGSRSVFEKVRAYASEELSTHSSKNASIDNAWGPIHGDFWTGNILVNNEQRNLFIIDWEMTQLGMRALDLGQVLAELYEIKQFKNNNAGIWIMESLIEGYPLLGEEQAFRMAVHMGVHLKELFYSA